MVIDSSENFKVKKVSNDSFIETDDEIAVEAPLEIQLIYGSEDKRVQKKISVTMRTPGNDEELAAGFLFTEGILQDREQVSLVSCDPVTENIILIKLSAAAVPSLQKAERNFYTTSSCGVCGKISIDAVKTVSVFQNTPDVIKLNHDLFYNLTGTLSKLQKTFESTGGLHASALFDFEGNLIMLREDVGRHNALDKVIGAVFLNSQLPLDNKILLLSGRASFELVQKSAMAGIKVIAAVGAPSSLAVKLAKDSDITLIGFLRDSRFNIYSGEHRIILTAGS